MVKNLYEIKNAVNSVQFPEFIKEVLETDIRSMFLENLVGRDLCNFKFMESPIESWLYEFDFDAGFIGEGVEPPTSTIRHAKFTVRPVKIGS